jgi:hypothetical protein
MGITRIAKHHYQLMKGLNNMAKQDRFELNYNITFKGYTRNGFMTKIIEHAMQAILLGLQVQYRSLKINVKKGGK